MGHQTGHSKLLLECGASPPPGEHHPGGSPGAHVRFSPGAFGWHQAPGLVQGLISDLLGDLGRGGLVVVQYLDDVLFVGHDPGEVAAVTDSAAHLLRRAGFIISEKSVFTPQRSLRWTGKDVDLRGRRVAPAASAVAAVVAAWVRLALKPYTYVALRRLLGSLGGWGGQGTWGGAFWRVPGPGCAGAHAGPGAHYRQWCAGSARPWPSATGAGSQTPRPLVRQCPSLWTLPGMP